jgi:hypothetical protein
MSGAPQVQPAETASIVDLPNDGATAPVTRKLIPVLHRVD